jgi:hypothetical protein
MKNPCPSCPDGNDWSSDGPTGRACPTCRGKAFIGEDDEDDSPYCECGAVHSIEETDSGQCDACGGIVE